MTNSPKACKDGHRCEPETLREALHCQVHHSRMGCQQIAERLGMTHTTLSNMVNPQHDTSALPTRHLPALLELTRDNPATLRYLAGLSGFVLVPLPMSTQLGETSRVVKEFGELLTSLADGHADGHITPREAARIALEGEQAIGAVAAVVQDARRRASSAITIPIGRPA